MWSFSWCIMGMLWCSFGYYGMLWGIMGERHHVFFVSFFAFFCVFLVSSCVFFVSFFRLFLSFDIVVKVLWGWYKDTIWVYYRVLSRCIGSVIPISYIIGELLGVLWGRVNEM